MYQDFLWPQASHFYHMAAPCKGIWARQVQTYTITQVTQESRFPGNVTCWASGGWGEGHTGSA